MSILGFDISSYLPSSKGPEIKWVFGQPYLNTTGFDTKHEQLHSKGVASVKINTLNNAIKVTVGVIKNSYDCEGIANAFRLTNVELLKLIANDTSHINDILNFLHRKCDGLFLICNIYVITKEATPTYRSTKGGIRNVTKILLGHHIILGVPLEEKIDSCEEIVQNIIQLISKSDDHSHECLMRDAAIFIDYQEAPNKPAFEALNQINDIEFFEDVVSLYAELPESLFYNGITNNSVEASTILKLKKFIYLCEKKFLFHSNYKCGKNPLSWSDRNKVAQDITRNIHKIYNLDLSMFPPPILNVTYNYCKILELEYCYAVYESPNLPELPEFLGHSLKNAAEVVKALPFKKEANAWIIEVNDQNAKEIYSIYLEGKTCIMFTVNTKHLVTEYFNESIIWLLSEEEKWKNSTEPVLIHNGKTEILLGLMSPDQCNNKTNIQKGKVFLDFCSCNTDKDPKAWICTKCKTLVHCIDEYYTYCECGVFGKESLNKKCFKCVQNRNETAQDSGTEKMITGAVLPVESNKIKESKSTIPTTAAPPNIPSQYTQAQRPSVITKPRTSLSPYVTPATTPTTAAPKPIVPTKKNFNILFIGQSGAGKSMLVNSIYNYLTYNFDEVSKAETVDCILPCQFQLQTPDFKKLVFKAGPQDENEFFNDNGQSVTQHPKVYNFSTKKYDCKIIDTPGLGDTRGAKQDEYNLNLIRNAIIDIKDLHAINFVMPSNISKLTANFEVNMRDLLSLFPKTALKNVHFFFTYANSTFFSIGDTRNTLEEFIANFKATNNAEIPFGIENVCCVDSEAFMYFIATKQGHKYRNRDHESFRVSWDKSKEAIEIFLTKMEEIKPIKSADILMTYELEQIGLLLQKESNPKLVELITVILTKISQISMTSKFISANIKNLQTMDEFKKQELFQALNLCQNHVNDPNLKQFIIKLVEEYGQPSENEIEKTCTAKNNTKNVLEDMDYESSVSDASEASETSIEISKDKKHTNGKIPPETPAKPPKMQDKSPSADSLREIAAKIGKEWENGRILKGAMENVLNIQIAGNQELKDIDQQKVKLSLERLLMYVNDELEEDINKFLKNSYS